MVATRSEMQVLALAIMPSLQLLLSTIRDSAQDLSVQGLPVKLHVTGLSHPLAQQDVLDAILSTEKARVPHVLASLTCGDDNVMDFGVSLAAVWHKYPHQDGSKFSVQVQFFHEAVPEIQQLYSSLSNVLTTGELEEFDAIRTASTIRDFFQDGTQWRTRTAPRPRGPGLFLG